MRVSPSLERTKVIVIGASGFGRESLDVLEAMIDAGSAVEILGVADDLPSSKSLSRIAKRNIAYLGSTDDLIERGGRGLKYILGIGNPSIREGLATKMEGAGFTPFTAVHPTAIIGTEVSWSPGVVVCSGAVISTNVSLGCHVHINPSVTIGHDSIVKDFASINPGSVISGEVLIEERALVGAGSIILQGLSVRRNSVIGAGSVVTRNVPPHAVVKGVPGRWKTQDVRK